MNINTIDQLMQQGVREKVFPGAVLLAASGDGIVYQKGVGKTRYAGGSPVGTDMVFDLASLTKPLATTVAVMHLVYSGQLNLDQSLGNIVDRLTLSDKSQIQIRHLLAHTSGLSAHQPYYERLTCLPMAQRKAALRRYLVAEPLAYATGDRVVYSDLGFMMLDWVVEHITGQSLDGFLAQTVYGPLGIVDLFFPGLENGQGDRSRFSHHQYAPTECCPWRHRVIEGAVHDDNAYAVGGIAGHAGLFGTAYGVFRLLSFLLSVYQGGDGRGIVDPHTVKTFWTEEPGTGRALGFDMVSPSGSSSGDFFSPGSVGHLGFTGTSFWLDIERAMMIVLLTNRVHPSRDNDGIKQFRPRIHDQVMKCIFIR